MSKRKLVWTLTAILLLVGAVGVYWNFFAEQSITISQSELQSRIDALLPTPDEQRFLDVPWRTNLMAARREAQDAHKPLFQWIMVGNPQGCT